jgi:hypothetical protein
MSPNEMSESQIEREKAAAAHSSGHEPDPHNVRAVPDHPIAGTGTMRPDQTLPGAGDPNRPGRPDNALPGSGDRPTPKDPTSTQPEGIRRPDGSYSPFGRERDHKHDDAIEKYESRLKKAVALSIQDIRTQTSNLHDLIDHVDNHGVVTRQQLDFVKGHLDVAINNLIQAAGISEE